MLTHPLNEHSELTARFDALVRATVLRYGPNSQALVFVLYDELRVLRATLAGSPGSVALAARVASVREHIQRLYDRSAFPLLDHSPVVRVRAAPVVLEYSREMFQQRYAAAAKCIQDDIVTVTSPAVQPLQPDRPYMFVIDDLGELRVWNRPFRLGDLVFGRDRATVNGAPVAHPMLVPDRLRVMAAGEIVFIGAPAVSAVIVNTKSGHFRPPPETAEVIRRVCRDVLLLPDRDVDIFVLRLPPEDGKNDYGAAQPVP